MITEEEAHVVHSSERLLRKDCGIIRILAPQKQDELCKSDNASASALARQRSGDVEEDEEYEVREKRRRGGGTARRG
jgi:hypothetical protein